MSQVRAYLQLVRLPAVFTAMADIFLGYLLNHNGFDSAWDFGFLLGASSSLYLAGMVFNDVFDRKVDAEQRPERPIPSGRVSTAAAVALGTVLMCGGVITASFVGMHSLQIAVGLTIAILAYNVVLKRTVLGPFAMGGCRFLNVMLGASASFFVWATPQIYVAAGLGVYVVGLTWFARHEAQAGSPRRLVPGMVVANLGLLLLIAFVLRPLIDPLMDVLALAAGRGGGLANPWIVLSLLAIIWGSINVRLIAAWKNPVPATIQTAVKTMLLSLVALDATLILFKIGTGEPLYAVATLALLIPAMTLGRWIYLT